MNPSGHLADTYAVDNSSSPAAQNYGNYEWTNADSAYSINSEIVEAEGIYTGYKYYETRYADTVLGQGNASDKTGSSNGKHGTMKMKFRIHLDTDCLIQHFLRLWTVWM
mgnify:FL=1